LVAFRKLIDEIWRNLAVLHSLHCQSDQFVLGGRGDRIAPLRLVAILAYQPNVHMLAWQVTLPTGYLEEKTFDARRFDDDLTHFNSPPLKSPDRTGKGSIAVISLLSPGVAMVVIAERLPETLFILFHEPQSPRPFGALPKIKMRNKQPGWTAVRG
jgi:hypothetical protein